LGSCSFLEPLDWHEVNDRSQGTTPTVWNANCGGVFGPELLFSRTLELEMGQKNHFEAVKNARGGTKIHEHWYPGHGKYWRKLRSSIRSRKGYGNWKAFIWHQGIQDALKDHRYEDTSLTYLGNLTGLIHQVRVEMFDASKAGTWQCKEEIPVVVVQIGYFPQTARAQRVREAQTLYCNGDPRAELVTVEDLSQFYHMDPPSLLIEGHRIAQAYQAAIQGNVTCSSTSAPGPSPTEAPITPSATSPMTSRPSRESSSVSSAPSASSSTSKWEDQS